MTKEEIRLQINDILINNLKFRNQLVENEELSLVNDLALDSLQILNLILLIEEKFGICIDADDIDGEKFDKVTYLVNYIYQALSSKECIS